MALAGARVLDLGAGTGSASAAAGGLGADVIAVDGAIDMLRHYKHLRPPAAVGDARSLPVSSGRFDCVVAAFLLNHLHEPVRALREICRVLRPGGVVVASTFAAGWNHPAKAHVDAAAASYGFTPPEWYRRLKREIAPSLGTARSLPSAAAAAGFAAANVHTTVVHVGLETPDDVAGWRLGMAHLATFVALLATRTSISGVTGGS